MAGLEVLDVAVGIVFVFLLVSILCSAIREAIEALLKTRGAYLWLGIRELLHGRASKELLASFYAHPLIYTLFPGDFDITKLPKKPTLLSQGRGMPSYLPSRNFAVALMDIAARGPLTSSATADATAPALSLDSIRANIVNLGNPAVQRVVLSAIDSAQGDLNRAQANVEAWFNSAMDRVSGWYKRTTQWWLFVIGLAVAVGMNVNTLVIVDFLYRTPAVRDAIVKKADALVKAKDMPGYDAAKAELASLSIPIGWENGLLPGRKEPATGFFYVVAVPLVGWLMTAFAATLGAPFWFDLLNKIMVIRATVKPHEKSPEEGSEDRQTKAEPPRQPEPAPTPTPTPAQAPPPAPAAATSASVAVTAIGRDVEADLDAPHGLEGAATPDDQLPPVGQGGAR